MNNIANAIIVNIDGEYEDEFDYAKMIGLKIDTSKGTIKLMISNSQSCCEDYNALFFETPDDIKKFIGSKIIDIKSVEIDNDNDSNAEYGLNCGGETQLKISTTKGVLQYAVYNSHNGYYSHARILQIIDDVDLEYL
jgi:hypothetical protein